MSVYTLFQWFPHLQVCTTDNKEIICVRELIMKIWNVYYYIIFSHYHFITDIYRTNMFHLTSTGCALVLQKDMEYWGIDELMMEPCCALKYYPEIETCVPWDYGIIGLHTFWPPSI